MAELFALPLLTSEWLADTSHLSRAERGLYMDVLILMWRSPGCQVPASVEWVARKLSVGETELPALKQILTEFCQTRVISRTKVYQQKRLMAQYDKVKNLQDRQSGNAKSRWDKEKTPSHGNATDPGSGIEVASKWHRSGNAYKYKYNTPLPPSNEGGKKIPNGKEGNGASSGVVVALGTDDWKAWEAHWRKTHGGRSPPQTDIRLETGVVRGWRFPTNRPPA